MWGRKEDNSPAPAAPAQPRSEPMRAQQPSRPAPAAAPAAVTPKAVTESTRGQAMIGKSLKIKGAITGREDLYIDGEVEGTIELVENSLTVGPNGNVNADVTARDITVLGRLTGNVKAGDRIEIRKTGSLEGDLSTTRIAIEDGAVFRGSIDITKPEQGSKSSPTPLKAAASAPQSKPEPVGAKADSSGGK